MMTGRTKSLENQSALPAIGSGDPVAQVVMRGTSGACFRKWTEGTSFHGGRGLTEERKKGDIRGCRWGWKMVGLGL